ncbi:MAG: hypothetical protein V4596_10695 [Bdellovibrionota bacterium]
MDKSFFVCERKFFYENGWRNFCGTCFFWEFNFFRSAEKEGILPAESTALRLSLLPAIVAVRYLLKNIKAKIGWPRWPDETGSKGQLPFSGRMPFF